MATIYVGNIPFHASEEEIRTLFSKYGSVSSVQIIMEEKTGRSRGFGFVEIEDETAAVAVQKLNNKKFKGRRLRVIRTT